MSQRFGEQVDEALRALGRLVALAGLSGVVLFLFGILLKPVLPKGLPSDLEGATYFWLLATVALTAAHVLVVALLERRDWRRTGLGADGWRPQGILLGAGLGGLIALAPIVAGLVGGPAAAVPPSWDRLTESMLVFTITVGVANELIFRGYALGVLADTIGAVGAAVLGAGVAAALTLRSSAVTPEALGSVFLLSLFLGALRLRTRSLAASLIAQMMIAVVALGTDGARDWRVTAPLLALVTFLLFWKLPPPKEGRGHD